MKELISSICDFSERNGFCKLSLSNQLLKVLEEIYEVSVELNDNDVDRLEFEIGDVFISLVTACLIHFGDDVVVIDKLAKISNTKLFIINCNFEHHSDITSTLINKWDYLWICHFKDGGLHLYAIECIVALLRGICSKYGIDFEYCIVSALRKNMERCNY